MDWSRARLGALYLGLALLAAGTVVGLTVPMSADLPEPWFREAYRVLFFHMPLAWAGTIFFLVAAGQSVRYLLTRRLNADFAAYGAAELGLVLLFLATVTGMIFARTQWGSWWNWDPRETSVFFVVLIYAAYLMLRGALPPDLGLRARVGAAYLTLASVPMVWLVAVFPRTANATSGSMHPTKPPIEAVHWQLIFAMFFAWLLVGWWASHLASRVAAAQAGLPEATP